MKTVGDRAVLITRLNSAGKIAYKTQITFHVAKISLPLLLKILCPRTSLKLIGIGSTPPAQSDPHTQGSSG